jgi:uncharacterized membrane-anchored protein
MLISGLFFLAAPVHADQAPYPKDEAALEAEYQAMHWQDGRKDYPLSQSGSHLNLPDGFYILLGEEAARYAFLSNGIEFPTTEALLYDETSDAEIVVEYVKAGFVKDGDWSDVDADDFLVQMREDQHKSNPERVKNGQEAFEVVGWVEPPSYDPTTHVAHYVIEMGTEKRHWMNAVAVKLGRSGYHQFTWAGGVEEFKAGGPKALASIIDSHTYDEGQRYADYKEGDDVAAYGIAGLVAAVAGVKLSKGLIAAAIAFLAVAGKKAAILIVAAAIGLRMAIKRFFRRS